VKETKMKNGTYSRKDNKPLTIRETLAILKSVENVDKPVTMSSDEEGNDMLQLCMVEIHNGNVTLYPAHF
jgi:hypothetical protein